MYLETDDRNIVSYVKNLEIEIGFVCCCCFFFLVHFSESSLTAPILGICFQVLNYFRLALSTN